MLCLMLQSKSLLATHVEPFVTSCHVRILFIEAQNTVVTYGMRCPYAYSQVTNDLPEQTSAHLNKRNRITY